MPALTVDGYKSLSLACKVSEVTDADVERELEFIQRRHAKTKEAAADVAAAPGQIVTISQTAEIEGSVFPEFTFEKVPVELGKKYLLPELEEGLVGMKAGEEKSLKIVVPEHVHDKAQVGKTAEATVKLEGIMEISLPEVNDELAKDMGLDSLEALRSNIKERLVRQAESHRRNQLETEIFEQLSAKNQFDVPPSMVDQVIDSMFEEMDFPSDKEKKAAKANNEERKKLRDTAKQRARNTLILSEIIKSEKIVVNEEDFDAYVRDFISGSGMGTESPDPKLLESIKASMGPHARESLLFKKALDFVISHANITETKEAGVTAG
jgi:trigger factor